MYFAKAEHPEHSRPLAQQVAFQPRSSLRLAPARNRAGLRCDCRCSPILLMERCLHTLGTFTTNGLCSQSSSDNPRTDIGHGSDLDSLSSPPNRRCASRAQPCAVHWASCAPRLYVARGLSLTLGLAGSGVGDKPSQSTFRRCKGSDEKGVMFLCFSNERHSLVRGLGSPFRGLLALGMS